MEPTYYPKIPDIMRYQKGLKSFYIPLRLLFQTHYAISVSFYPHTIFIHFSMGNSVDSALVRLLCLLISSLMVIGVASSRATSLGIRVDDKLNQNNQPLRRNLLANGLGQTPAMGYVLIFINM